MRQHYYEGLIEGAADEVVVDDVFETFEIILPVKHRRRVLTNLSVHVLDLADPPVIWFEYCEIVMPEEIKEKGPGKAKRITRDHIIGIPDTITSTPESHLPAEYKPQINPEYASGVSLGLSQYISIYSASNSELTPTTLREYYMPIVVPYLLNVTSLAVYCTVAEIGKQVRLGIFSFEKGIVTNLIYSNIIDLDSVGAREVYAEVTLGIGVYCLGFLSDVTTGKVRQASVNPPLLGYMNADAVDVYTHYAKTGVWADGFSDNPDVTLKNDSVPLIFLRVN